MNGDLVGLKFNKMSENMLTLAYYRAQANTKKILIYDVDDVDFIKGYNIYQYLFVIHFCSILAKC